MIYNQTMLFSIFLFFFSLFFPPVVLAKSYTITPVVIDYTVSPSGSMSVSEDRTYNFSGDYTFAYQTIENKSPYKIRDIKLNLPDDTYSVRDDGDSYYIKWFFNASNESLHFVLSYTVDNAVVTQGDVDEIYWKIVGDKWDLVQSDIATRFHLPAGIDGLSIKAWAHGPLSGRVAIDSSELVTYTLPTLPPGEFFEARMIFPHGIINTKASGSLTSKDIIEEENKFIQDTISAQQSHQFLAIGAIAFGLLLIYLALKIFIKELKLFKRFGRDLPLPSVNLAGRLWDPPSDLPPAQVEQLIRVSKKLSPRAFTATILALVQTRHFRLLRSDKKKGIFSKKYSYYLLPTTSRLTLSPSIKYIFELLTERIGTESVTVEGRDQAVIPLDSIIAYFKAHATSAQSILHQFEDKAFSANLTGGYLDKEAHASAQKYGSLVWSILLFIVSVFQLAYPALLAVQALVATISLAVSTITLVAVIIFKANGEKRTAKGSQEAASWIAFGKHLKEYSVTKNYPIDSVILWEKYLVYGTLLGISAKALSEFPIHFSENDSQVVASSWAGANIGSTVDISSSIASVGEAISSLGSVSTSSYGASGSGSSGGASGGGGGGGGGGAGGAG